MQCNTTVSAYMQHTPHTQEVCLVRLTHEFAAKSSADFTRCKLSYHYARY